MSAPGHITIGLMGTRIFMFGTPATCLLWLVYDAYALDKRKEEDFHNHLFEKAKIERAVRRELESGEPRSQ